MKETVLLILYMEVDINVNYLVVNLFAKQILNKKNRLFEKIEIRQVLKSCNSGNYDVIGASHIC